MSVLLNDITNFELPVETARKILIDFIEKDTGKKVKELTFNMGSRSIGYGPMERDEQYLRCINVVFEK